MLLLLAEAEEAAGRSIVLCVPFCHLQDARHVNFVASGAPFSASRASSSAWTLTPLLTVAIAIVSLFLCSGVWRKLRIIHRPRTGRERGYDRADGHVRLKGRRRLGRHGRNAVPRSADAARARLRTHAASGPDRLRDLRHAVAGARQRDSRLPCAERRRARRRLREDAAGRRARATASAPRIATAAAGTRARLVGRHDRPRQGLRHQSLLRRQHEPARRMPRDDRTVVDEPGDRQALRIGLSRDHRRRHGPRASARSWTSSASRGSPRSPADRSAACRRSSGPSCTPIRSTRSW